MLQEEILNDHPERLRAVLCYAANPLRSYADTTAYENAFQKLDLLVVADIVMSETAALAHYVLPCKTAFESWEGNPGHGYFEGLRPDEVSGGGGGRRAKRKCRDLHAAGRCHGAYPPDSGIALRSGQKRRS